MHVLPPKIKQEFFPDFQRMQSGMYMTLCNRVFSYGVSDRYIHISIYCLPFIHLKIQQKDVEILIIMWHTYLLN